jgi:glutamate/tyrosine decarboxylase-like PLP-dependent enzyme
MVANAMNQPGFTWASSPAATELEMATMEWLRKAFKLPETMSWKTDGGGVLQPTATEAMITNLLAAKNRAIDHASIAPDQIQEKMAFCSKMCVYYSDQSHFCIEKAAKILAIPYVRKIKSVATGPTQGGNRPVDIPALKQAILDDKAAGRVPIFVSANFGATGICAIDDLWEIGQFANAQNIWFNVDAAYAGVVAMLPECRDEMRGVELADSLLINGSKWFSVMFNCSFHFFTSRKNIVTSLNATGVFLDNEQTSNQKVFDLKDYHLGLGRPFRSLKLFTTLRSFGLKGMRATLRRHITLAKYTAEQLENTGLFNIVRVKYGLICFNLAGGEKMESNNQALLQELNKDKNMHLVHTIVESEGTVLRISLAHPKLDHKHMDNVVEKITSTAKTICLQNQVGI